MTPFVPKNWVDSPSTSTPISAAALEDLEDRLSDYTDSELLGHTGDASAAHAASAISFSPTGTVAATTVQAAIAEVASEAPGGGSAPVRINAGGNLGAAYTLPTAGAADVWLVNAITNVNSTITITGLAAGVVQRVKIIGVKGAAGTETLSVDDGSGAVSVSGLPTAAGAVFEVNVDWDGTDSNAYIVGAVGVADASTTVKGATKVSKAPASAANPIALGSNDERVQPQGRTTATPTSENLTGTLAVAFVGAELKVVRGPLTGDVTLTSSGAVAGSRMTVLAVQGATPRSITIDGNAVSPISQTNGVLIRVDVVYVDVASVITPHIVATTTETDPLAVLKTLGTTKGDLLVWTASGTVARQAVGTDGMALVADSASTNGVKYVAGADEPVNTVATSSTAQTIPAPAVQAISRITLTANCTLTFPAAAAGRSFTVVLVQDGTGSRTVTWPTVLWPGGTTPTLTTTAAKRDVFTFMCVDGTNWLGFVSGQNL